MGNDGNKNIDLENQDGEVGLDSRRSALKVTGASTLSVILASQLPSDWKKPVVDSVLLPAHAELSVGGGGEAGGGEGDDGGGDDGGGDDGGGDDGGDDGGVDPNAGSMAGSMEGTGDMAGTGGG